VTRRYWLSCHRAHVAEFQRNNLKPAVRCSAKSCVALLDRTSAPPNLEWTSVMFATLRCCQRALHTCTLSSAHPLSLCAATVASRSLCVSTRLCRAAQCVTVSEVDRDSKLLASTRICSRDSSKKYSRFISYFRAHGDCTSCTSPLNNY